MRKLLIIDQDTQFQEILKEQVAPYGFELHIAEPSPKALKEVEAVGPELIIIAVEEPDKVGYTLCNKAKKGVAKQLPVILTTGTVPASGFNKHRKLRVHADEYIDKRTMSSDEVLAKIGSLIQLGEARPATATEAIDLDGFDEIDFALDNIEASAQVEEETFQVDEESFEVDFDDAEDGFEVEIPDIDDVEEIAESPPAVVDVFASAPVEPLDDPPSPSDFDEPTGIDNSLHDETRTAAAQMFAEPDEATSVSNVSADDGASSAELLALQEQVRTLQAQLQSVSAPAEDISRDREVLNLKEMLNKKEKSLLSLRDEIGEKERMVLDVKERLRQLEHSRTSLDEKNLQLEQQLLESKELLDQNKRQVSSLETQISSLEESAGEMKESHQLALTKQEEELQAQHEDTIGSIKEEHESTVAELKSAHQREIESLGETHREELARSEKSFSEKLEEELKTAEQKSLQKIESLANDHEFAMAALREKEAEARNAVTELESSLSEQTEVATKRAGEIVSLQESLEKLESKTAELKTENSRLEEENQGYQQQILKAYERLQRDSDAANRAKKALAIALTVLDEEIEENI